MSIKSGKKAATSREEPLYSTCELIQVDFWSRKWRPWPKSIPWPTKAVPSEFFREHEC